MQVQTIIRNYVVEIKLIMRTLKATREAHGILQSQLARTMNISIPALSTYEMNRIIPPLEDSINLERHFNARINWYSNINPDDTGKIMEAFNALVNHYPLTAVLNFSQRWLKMDLKQGVPSRGICHFARQAGVFDGEPLISPGL